MRKGRGLVDQDIYDELLKVPGSRRLLIENTTNHRIDPKSKKLRAEIHEDAWPEVKAMVANWKRTKKGQPQKPFPKKETPQPKASVLPIKAKSPDHEKEKRITKLKELKPGDEFAYKNVGYGCVTYDHGGDAVEIKNGKLYTESFSEMGMEWDGRTWKFDGGLGLVTYIVLMKDVPEDAKFPE